MQDFAAIPGVAVVGGVSSLPLTSDGANGGFWDGSVTNFEQPPPPPIGNAEFRVASPGYFDAAGIPLLCGRAFADSDRRDSAQVAVISASAAKATWGEADPIGKQIQFGNMDGDLHLLTIVGVVGDVRQHGLDREAPGTVYVALAQRPMVAAEFNVIARTNLPIASVMPSLRRMLESNAKGIPYSLRPLADVRASALADRRFSLILLGSFAGVAFTLAISGLYGLMAFAVGQRQGEFALRQALGSTRKRIARLVVEGGMRIGIAGVVLGMIGAIAVARLAGNRVQGVPAIDVPILLGVCIVLLITLLLACLLPARRASAVDQRDARTGLAQGQGRPPAKGAGAHDGDIGQITTDGRRAGSGRHLGEGRRCHDTGGAGQSCRQEGTAGRVLRTVIGLTIQRGVKRMRHVSPPPCGQGAGSVALVSCPRGAGFRT